MISMIIGSKSSWLLPGNSSRVINIDNHASHDLAYVPIGAGTYAVA